MKLSEFIVLTESQKRSAVLNHGVALAKRNLLNHMVFLFQLSGYYVEAYCCYDSKEIQEYVVFQTSAQLAPYLDAIQIDQLWS